MTRTTTRIPFVRFAVEVLHLPLTLPWRVLLAVTIDGVQPGTLEGEEREVARVLFGDVGEIDPRLRRVQVWRCGRSAGKSTLAAALLVYGCWTCMLPKDGHGHIPVGFGVSVTKPLAKILQGVARELVRGSELDAYVVGDTTDGFLLRRGDGRTVEIASVAASKGGANLRGRDVAVLVVDEAEFLGSEESGAAVNDRDQVSAVMPRLLGHVLLISTPWPSSSLCAEYFDRNHGHPVDAVAALGESMFMRPSEQLAQDIARETARDVDNADREYRCKTLASGGSRVYDSLSVDAGTDASRPLVVYAPRFAIVGAGGDAGLESDESAVAAVANVDGTFELLEIDSVRPTKGNPLAPSYVFQDRFAPVAKRHGATGIMMDAHYRMSATELLEDVGLEFLRLPEGAPGKFETYMFLRGLFRAGKMKIPAIPRLVAQLKAVTQTPVDRGRWKITSPRRAGQGHGDLVSALVAATWAAREESDAGTINRPGFVENGAAVAAALFGGGFDPSMFTGPRQRKIPPIRSCRLPSGAYLLEGQPPTFTAAHSARFHRKDPAVHSAAAANDPAWAAAVAKLRAEQDY
jgi:hypothetical protein